MVALVNRNRYSRLADEANGIVRDAPSEPKLCPVCKNARYVRRAVAAIDHPDFGLQFPCPACTKDERTTEERLLAFGFSGRMKTFTEWTPDPAMTPALKAVAELLAGQRWVVMLRGVAGCGKTHIAQATAHTWVERGGSAGFWNVPDLLDAIRSTYDKGSDIAQYTFLHERVYNRDLLVLDDLGANKPTDWANAMLYEIVDTIYRGRDTKKLIVTTNVNDVDSKRLVGDVAIIESRLLSRVLPGDVALKASKDRRPEFDR